RVPLLLSIGPSRAAPVPEDLRTMPALFNDGAPPVIQSMFKLPCTSRSAPAALLITAALHKSISPPLQVVVPLRFITAPLSSLIPAPLMARVREFAKVPVKTEVPELLFQLTAAPLALLSMGRPPPLIDPLIVIWAPAPKTNLPVPPSVPPFQVIAAVT